MAGFDVAWFIAAAIGLVIGGYQLMPSRERLGYACVAIGCSFFMIGIARLILDIRPKPSVQQVAKVDNTAEIELSLTCDTVILPMPYHGDMWQLDTIFLKGLSKYSPNPLKLDWVWPEPNVEGVGFRCVVQNHGASPVFGVVVPLEALASKIIHGKHSVGWKGGEMIGKYHPIISVPRPLAQQGQDPFIFYVCNYDPDRLIEIILPTFAFINEDDKKTSKVALRIAATLGNQLEIAPTRHRSGLDAIKDSSPVIGDAPESEKQPKRQPAPIVDGGTAEKVETKVIRARRLTFSILDRSHPEPNLYILRIELGTARVVSPARLTMEFDKDINDAEVEYRNAHTKPNNLQTVIDAKAINITFDGEFRPQKPLILVVKAVEEVQPVRATYPSASEVH
jgi:hypothetical protein